MVKLLLNTIIFLGLGLLISAPVFCTIFGLVSFTYSKINS